MPRYLPAADPSQGLARPQLRRLMAALRCCSSVGYRMPCGGCASAARLSSRLYFCFLVRCQSPAGNSGRALCLKRLRNRSSVALSQQWKNSRSGPLLFNFTPASCTKARRWCATSTSSSCGRRGRNGGFANFVKYCFVQAFFLLLLAFISVPILILHPQTIHPKIHSSHEFLYPPPLLKR